MHRLFFSHMGMFHMRKVTTNTDLFAKGNKYVADYTIFRDIKLKKNMENLDCKVYFDDNADITLVEDGGGPGGNVTVYQPGDEYWGWAKLKARSAAFVLASMEHLIHYHMNWANIPGMALRMYLQPDHPLRMALTPHFFRTHQTCQQAETLLIQKGSPVHRNLPFESEGGLTKMWTTLLSTFRFKAWPDELEEKGMLGDEFYIGATDAMDFHKILMNYASNLIDEIYPSVELFDADHDLHKMHDYLVKKMKAPAEFSRDNVKKFWAEIIFRVTGMHTLIGNTIIFALEPFFMNFRLDKRQRGKVYGNHECLRVVALVSATTIPDTFPSLSGNWTQVIHDPVSKAYSQLDTDLDELSKEIDGRNKVRRFVNNDFIWNNTQISVFS
ncbi:MAG: hypothetical protein ACPH86_06310 [Schleiferiaceae bacterium]